MSIIGCKIITKIVRPDQDLINLFKGVPVANIDDCMNRMAAVSSDIKPVNNRPLLGTAFTVKLPVGDNLMLHKAMDLAQPGDILVIDAGGDVSRAIFGELMVSYCRQRGLGGIVINGAVRDYDSLRKIDFPLYARGYSPNGPYKNGPGEINTIISFGGVIVKPGDIIVGDGDGIVVINPDEAESIISEAKDIAVKEANILDEVRNSCCYERPWVDIKLKEIGCQIV